MDVRRCVVAVLLVSCSGGRSAAPAPRHFGDVMSEVGRRFERAGRAADAGRWDLARYDLDELDEIFDDDIPNAVLPDDVHGVDLRGIAAAFAATYPAELRRAATAHDRAAFATAFAHTAAACNSCHTAARRPFIEVPSIPGESVPAVGPVP